MTPRQEKPLDGVDLSSLLLGRGESLPRRLIFSHWSGSVSARDEHYMLDATGQLFDLTSDAGQTKNIRAAQPDVAEKMSSAVSEWKKTVLAELTKGARPFTVGYREFPLAVLPARDGVPHGGIQRSARAPNCSFFTHWTGPEDRITWDIAVATAGALSGHGPITRALRVTWGRPSS